MLGGALAIGGLVLATRGVPGAPRAIGTSGAAHAIKHAPAGQNPMETAIIASDKAALGGILSLNPLAAGIYLMGRGVADERNSGRNLDAALAECAKRYEGANTFLSFLNF